MSSFRNAYWLLLCSVLHSGAFAQAQERKHIDITVHLVRVDKGTALPNTRIELWTTDQAPGHGLGAFAFHARQQTDAAGIARFSIAQPAQQYLVYTGDFDSCPTHNSGIALSKVATRGVVIGNTCTRKKDAVRPLTFQAIPGELLIPTLKPR